MQVDKLKKGTEHIKSASGAGKKFTPSIYWKEDKEEKTLAFITSVEDMYTLDIHVYPLPAGWRTFVCRRNPAFEDESGGYCPLCERAEAGDEKAKLTRKHFALAAELEPVVERVGGRRTITSLTVKMIEKEKDGTTKRYPRIGVVMQSASNFYDYLTTYDTQRQDITTCSFEIVRSGKGPQSSYQFFPVDMRPDLSEFEDEFPSLIEYISDLGSAERYSEELGVSVPSNRVDEEDPTAPEPTVESERAAETSFEELRARLESGTK